MVKWAVDLTVLKVRLLEPLKRATIVVIAEWVKMILVHLLLLNLVVVVVGLKVVVVAVVVVAVAVIVLVWLLLLRQVGVAMKNWEVLMMMLNDEDEMVAVEVDDDGDGGHDDDDLVVKMNPLEWLRMEPMVLEVVDLVHRQLYYYTFPLHPMRLLLEMVTAVVAKAAR